MLNRIDHIGFVVRNLDQALERFERVFKLRANRIITKEKPRLRIAFIPIGDATIELVEPVPGEGGPGKALEQYGEGFSHIAFQVSNIEEVLTGMKKDGIQLRDSEPRMGAVGSKVAFISPKETINTLTELVEEKE